MTDEKIAIFWFRRDLRLEDNAGLFHACKSGLKVLPIFIFDKNILDKLTSKNDARVCFIYQQLQEIHNGLKSFGGNLILRYGIPLEVFESLLLQYPVAEVYANEDYEPYAIERDTVVSTFLNSRNIAFKSYKDQVIFHKDDVLKKNGTPYTVFTPYSKEWLKHFSLNELNTFHSKEAIKHNIYKKIEESFPDIDISGFKRCNMVFIKPEIPVNIIENYHNTRDFPYMDKTSRLSIHLRFGTISIREVIRIAYTTNKVFLNELIWREFYMMILYHFPYVENASFKSKYDLIPWLNNENEFKRWCTGETGYPMVDAGIRQLLQTGFIHNRARMIVASFLTKHLLIDWHWGERFFADTLLDFDLAANNGGWQWAASSGVDAAPYFRIFNPVMQQKRFDANLEYIKKWLPEYGTSRYPKPIVEHELARKRALETYANTLKQ